MCVSTVFGIFTMIGNNGLRKYKYSSGKNLSRVSFCECVCSYGKSSSIYKGRVVGPQFQWSSELPPISLKLRDMYANVVYLNLWAKLSGFGLRRSLVAALLPYYRTLNLRESAHIIGSSNSKRSTD